MIIALLLLGPSGAARASAPANPVSAATIRALIQAAKEQLAIDPDRSLVLSEQASSAALRYIGPDSKALSAEADASLAKGLIRAGEIDRADDIVSRALGSSREIALPPRILGELFLSLGKIQMRRDDVQAALANTQRAYRIFRSAKEVRQQAIALQAIALLYIQGGDSKTALRYYAQSEQEYSSDPQMSFAVHNNRGRAFLELSQPIEAEREFRTALRSAEKVDSKKYMPILWSNIAQAQINQGHLTAASASASQAFSIIRSSKLKAETWPLWELRAQIAFLQSDLPSAKSYIERVLAGVDPRTSASNYRQAHDTAYKIYRASDRPALALANLEALARIDEATAKLTASASAALMAARFDFTNQNLKIAQLKALELERSAAAQRKLLITVVIGGVLVLSLLILGLIIITRSRNRERAAKLILARTNRELEKAISAKMEFLATTSHEIRTPLNGILGMTQVMLSDRTLEPQLRDRIGVVHSAGENMRTLVDDILDVAKMETGNLAVGTGAFDLKATLRQVAQVWRLQADAAGIGLILHLDDCPEQIEGDGGRLRQIVFNLLSNAMKFTEDGKVELSAKTAGSPAARRVLISVRDSGIGIERAWHESIFELFQQVDGGTTRRYGGTGLGLAICRNLARAMGGDISVESEPGFGSTFTIDLPLVEIDARTDTEIEAGSKERARAVLAIERNPLTRGILRAILGTRFTSVTFVSSAAEACDHLAHEAVDWIVADSASTEAFEGIFAATSAPVILVEGAERVEPHVRSAVHTVLSKPVTRSMLLDLFDTVEQDELADVA